MMNWKALKISKLETAWFLLGVGVTLIVVGGGDMLGLRAANPLQTPIATLLLGLALFATAAVMAGSTSESNREPESVAR